MHTVVKLFRELRAWMRRGLDVRTWYRGKWCSNSTGICKIWNTDWDESPWQQSASWMIGSHEAAKKNWAEFLCEYDTKKIDTIMNVGDGLWPSHVHVYHWRVPREELISSKYAPVIDRLHANLGSEHHFLTRHHSDATIMQTLIELLSSYKANSVNTNTGIEELKSMTTSGISRKSFSKADCSTWWYTWDWCRGFDRAAILCQKRCHTRAYRPCRGFVLRF